MKCVVLATLACGLILFGTAGQAAAATNAVLMPVLASSGPAPSDKEKLATLGKKLHALKKEVQLLENMVKKEKANDGNRLRIRRATRRLAQLKSEAVRIESLIRALKAKLVSHPKPKTKPDKVTSKKTYQVQKNVQARVHVNVPVRKNVRTTVRHHAVPPRKIQGATPPHAGRVPTYRKAATTRPTPASKNLAAAVHRRFAETFKKLHAHYSHLLKEKASLEARLKKTHEGLARAKQAMAKLKKEHALRLRKLHEEARKRTAVRRTAALAAQRRHVMSARPTRGVVPGRSRGVDHGPLILKELRLLRQDVHKIARLLESMLKNEQKEHAPRPPVKQRKHKKTARDLRTL